MRFDRTLMTLAAVALAATPGMAPHAQSGNGNMPLDGPAIAGVCMLSREAIFANAKVGLAASARLKQLAQQAQNDIDAERKPVDTDIQAFRTQSASLSADQRQSREQALTQRMQAIQADQALRTRELEATRAKAMQQIAQYAQPVITSTYRGKNCGLLLDRNAVLGGNMSNDITAAVVQGLDAKVTTISFNLETLPASGPQTGTP
ncbi:OmpH family outer membrane protein [Dyella jejuensis]|uniref:OmpH family outer membrane protein n=1 Tax=Dyella jejuensis TaxID=1432009 RepID=A0ABW8JF57_9GAMM